MKVSAASRPQVPIRLALATSRLSTTDDQSLIRELRRFGVVAETVVWSDENTDWSSFAGVVIRSCWDYHLRLAEFLEWVDRVDAAGVMLINSPVLVRWNSSKRYLAELAAHGFVMPDTIIIPQGASSNEITAAINALSSHDALVAKPAVSASACDTWRMDLPLAQANLDKIGRMCLTADVVLQNYVKTITVHGELSLVFFDGEFSHAVCKRPCADEFRVQSEFGGTVVPVRPSLPLQTHAHSILKTLPEMPVYARVDGVQVDDAFVLMELELIEPELFLSAHGSAQKFADAIATRLNDCDASHNCHSAIEES